MPISSERKEARRQHLVQTARELIRQTGSAGFPMSELAKRAGVSGATPYNLIGSKNELLRLVVRQEFDLFNKRLTGQLTGDALDQLFGALDLIVEHYGEDPEFYFGLYRSSAGIGMAEFRPDLLGEGTKFWAMMIEAAMAEGALSRTIDASTLTTLLLRSVGATVFAWLLEGWSIPKFQKEMRLTSRVLLLGLLKPARARDVSASFATL